MSTVGVVRNSLLVASENAWLRQHVSTLPFVRRAVSRFMPGERLDAALAAAAELQRLGIGAVRARSLDCHISVKLTQLGEPRVPPISTPMRVRAVAANP